MMPIQHSKQKWEVGQTVKVGFMTLLVTDYRPTPGDYLPDVYTLVAPGTGREYEFTPHHGLSRVNR